MEEQIVWVVETVEGAPTHIIGVYSNEHAAATAAARSTDPVFIERCVVLNEI